MNQFQASTEKMIENSVQFLKKIYKQHDKKNGLIAVSGGIDSALSLTLLTKALGKERVHAVLMPYDAQDMTDAQTIVEWNKLSSRNVQVINIKPIVDGVVSALQTEVDAFRLGNIMARVRMIVLFDQAKKLDALVCGTENKSEKYLGYFTRFGDEASDVEPLQGFYKTQIRVLSEHLQLPEVFLKKSPSAELWKDQTDEQELGFSYAAADQVFEQLLDAQNGVLYLQLVEGKRLVEVTDKIAQALPALPKETITAILERVVSQQFKHEVPYTTESNY
jgi:NAD+ synthase